MCLLYGGIIFVILFVGASYVLYKVKPQVYVDPQDNAFSWSITYIIVIILINIIGDIVLERCGS